MQLSYFQFRRFGLVVPLVFIAAVAAVAALPEKITPAWLSNRLYFSATVFFIAAFLCLALWRILRTKEAIRLWDELSEEWVLTRDLDEFMYLKFWQWALFYSGCAITFLIVAAFD